MVKCPTWIVNKLRNCKHASKKKKRDFKDAIS